MELEKKTSMNPLPTLSIILSLLVLHLPIILHHFYSQLKNILVTFQSIDTRLKPATSVITNQEENPEPGKNLSREEVLMVMERLGMMQCRVNDEDDEFCPEIAEVFIDQEPSLEEVKDAFKVFDENGDGVIDAGELSKLLCAVRFAEVGEGDCRRLMSVFDENGDGVIDLGEFTKLVEKSLT